ncbi:MAG: hypothetical protein GY719_12355 [bacterium]|nr:hypothetical protein [bacterium]
MKGRNLSVTVGLALLVTGCLATLVPPDFEDVYDPAAADHHPERNPVIVIPGFLGTRLVDAASETVVWGAVGGGYADPSTPEGARLVALSMRPEVPSPQVVPDGVLDSFRIRGLSIQLKPYVHTLRALGAAGYRDEDLTRRDVNFRGEHLNSFQFAYDWRRGNAENAKRLHELILEKAAYCRADRKRRGLAESEVRFDLISHSMGGLLARYYLRYGPQPLPEDGSLPELTWAGARHIERAILVAPPNAGAGKATLHLTQGVRHAPGFPFYDAMINGTFPAAYELLPRARHGAYVDAREPSRRLDSFLDPELWERAGWGLAARDREELLAWLLPDVDDPGERRRLALAHQRRLLRRADQFQRALDLPASPPAGTELFLIAGDSAPTAAVLAVDPETGEVEVARREVGDGSVLRTSALMDERLGAARTPEPRSPISWRQVVFIDRRHSRMSIDPAFADRVVYWLLEAPRPFPV